MAVFVPTISCIRAKTRVRHVRIFSYSGTQFFETATVANEKRANHACLIGLIKVIEARNEDNNVD